MIKIVIKILTVNYVDSDNNKRNQQNNNNSKIVTLAQTNSKEQRSWLRRYSSVIIGDIKQVFAK